MLIGFAGGWAILGITEVAAYGLTSLSIILIAILSAVGASSTIAFLCSPRTIWLYALTGMAPIGALTFRIMAFLLGDLPVGSPAVLYRLPGITVSILLGVLHWNWWSTSVREVMVAARKGRRGVR